MNPLPDTRTSLLIRLKENSNDAWLEFLEIYQNAILRFSEAKGLQPADAEDVAQEVLSAVESKIHRWEHQAEKGKFRHWLITVARNVAVDHFKKKVKTPGVSLNTLGDPAEIPLTQDSPVSLFQFEYRRSLFQWAAQKIEKEFQQNSWRSFQLVAIEGQKPDQVAKKLGMSVGSVYAAKGRILARLKNVIRQFEMNEQESPPDQSASSDSN